MSVPFIKIYHKPSKEIFIKYEMQGIQGDKHFEKKKILKLSQKYLKYYIYIITLLTR